MTILYALLYVALSNIFHMKMCINYSNRKLLRRLVNYEELILHCKVVNFVLIIFLWISLDFLSMITYEVLYVWILRYTVCSAWFIDIRISACY